MIVSLPIVSIRLDDSTVEKAREVGADISPDQLYSREDTFSLSDTRLSSLEQAVEKLPPVDVIQRGDSSYVLLNGRHRVVLALKKGNEYIEAKIH